MESAASKEIYATVAFDRQGNIVEVRNSRGEMAREGSYGQRKVGDACPEGTSKINTVKTVEIEVVTCADTKDPCWYHNRQTCRWYYLCS